MKLFGNTIELVDDWDLVLKHAGSMWANYLGLIVLVVPEIFFWITGIDYNGSVTWTLGVVLILYGTCRRVFKQARFHSDRTNSPWLIGLVVLVLGIAFYLGDWQSHFGADASQGRSEAAQETLADLSAGVSTEERFLPLAIQHVGGWEGTRLEAYQDIVGVWTICSGETRGVQPGEVRTRAECEESLRGIVLEYRAGLHRFLTDETRRVRLPPTRDVAFSSLAVNVGIHGAGNSTAVRRLNRGDIRGSCEALTWWNKAGGRVIRGLVNRRTEEKALCLMGLVA